MLRRICCLAACITVAGHVAAVQLTVASVSSICDQADECYVNGVSSEVCDRKEESCKRCLMDNKSNSLLASAEIVTEYICYDVDPYGECPTGTTKCPARMMKSLEDNENESTLGIQSSKSAVTFDLVDQRSPPSNSELSESSTPKVSSIKGTFTNLISTTNSSDNIYAFGMNEPTTKTPSTSLSKPTTLLSQNDKVLDDEPSIPVNNVTLASQEHTSAAVPEKPGSVYPIDTNASQFADKVDPSSQPLPAPAFAATTHTATTRDEVLSQNDILSSTTRNGFASDGTNTILIVCVVCGAAAILVLAAFVVWKTKQNQEDLDDDDSALSPNKAATRCDGSSLPSASAATTAYSAEPARYDSNNYEHQSRSNYSNNYVDNYGHNCYSNDYTTTQYATGGGPDAVTGVAPAFSSSEYSIDMNNENHLRRTDSILGGTGVMSSTTSSFQTPFDFTGGPSPADSDMNQDIWGNEVGSHRQRHAASTVSVEF